MCDWEIWDAEGKFPGLIQEEVSSDSASIPESTVHDTCGAEGMVGDPAGLTRCALDGLRLGPTERSLSTGGKALGWCPQPTRLLCLWNETSLTELAV